jgi:hypothetical protein
MQGKILSYIARSGQQEYTFTSAGLCMLDSKDSDNKVSFAMLYGMWTRK